MMTWMEELNIYVVSPLLILAIAMSTIMEFQADSIYLNQLQRLISLQMLTQEESPIRFMHKQHTVLVMLSELYLGFVIRKIRSQQM